MREIALHLLDIAENSVAADAETVEITIEENVNEDELRLVVEDNGRGMDQQMVARITDPFVTTRTTRKVGLGIPLFKAAAEACNGYLTIDSQLGEGTRLEAVFQHSHIDRMPLGDLPSTLLTLVVGFPEVHWIFHYHFNDTRFTFDDKPIKEILDGVPLSEPSVLTYIRETLEEGIRSARHATG